MYMIPLDYSPLFTTFGKEKNMKNNKVILDSIPGKVSYYLITWIKK